MKPTDIIGSICGFVTTIIGVFQMQLFKDLNIELEQFSYLLFSKERFVLGNGKDKESSSALLLPSTRQRSSDENFEYEF